MGNVFGALESTISLHSMAILSVIFAATLVFIATRKFTIASGVITILVAGIIYLLSSSARGQNLEGSLPSVTYPVRNLGKDGVSLANMYPNHIRQN